jgi:DNA-binding NtrC family response regulator
VLLLGESGTGKELIARNIHRHSPRASGPFVAVNSSAIPSGLIETEFFGHERGAFTDAKDRRIGRFEQADKGTLFLDEVGDLPLDAQAKLLRVIEEREVTRVGSSRTIEVNVRVISATNKNLEEAMRQGRFREDLYWRINVFPIQLPPLRERMSDVRLLVNCFIDRLNTELGRNIGGVSDELLQWMLSHDWPGNVRELENLLRRSMILAEGPVLQLCDLRSSIGRPVEESPALALGDIVARVTERAERIAIENALAQCRGSRTATAAALDINRKTLFNKMKQYGLTDDDRDENSD